MSPENDLLLSCLTVQIKHAEQDQSLGTGVIYYNPQMNNVVYVFTAAHTLFADGDALNERLEKVKLCFYNPATNNYCSIVIVVNYDLVIPDKDQDLAILIVDKVELETLNGKMPLLRVVRDRQDTVNFYS